jgi:hypothetical protein
VSVEPRRSSLLLMSIGVTLAGLLVIGGVLALMWALTA